jgi:hypothetical protein
MDAEPSERFVPIYNRNEFPLSYYEVVDYMISVEYADHIMKRPPEEVSAMIHDFICHAENATAVFHPEHGWFVIKAPCNLIAWWKRTTYLGV